MSVEKQYLPFWRLLSGWMPAFHPPVVVFVFVFMCVRVCKFVVNLCICVCVCAAVRVYVIFMCGRVLS